MIASVLIVVVSLGTAGVAYAAVSKLTYTASCTAEVFVRAPATNLPNPTPDFLTFTNNLAANQVSLATPTVYKNLAKVAHLSPGAIGGKILISPSVGIGAFRVTITDSDATRANLIAKSACPEFVRVITKQRADEIGGNVKVIQSRMTTIQGDLKPIQAKPAKRRTQADVLSLATQQEALRINALLIAGLKSMPPDQITVLTPASGVSPVRSASLKKYLLIAAVAALLVIFLYIMIVEALSPQGRRAAPPDAIR